MGKRSDRVTVDRQALIAAVLELERQYTLNVYRLLSCAGQLGTISETMHGVLGGNGFDTAKRRLFELLLPEETVFDDALLETWQAEWASEQLPSDS